MNFTRWLKLVNKRRGEKVDLEEILYNLKQKRVGKKVVKVVLTRCLFVVVVFVILLVVAIILATNYHTQIYDGFLRSINFIFGDSPQNVISGFIKQISDNFIKTLFN